MTVQARQWALKGGLDLESPAMSIEGGRTILSQNYECSLTGGYRRISGYTLWDGSETPSAVSGSGDILGLWKYNDDLYAFRNSADGSECKMYKSTTSGWTEINTGVTLAPNGSYNFVNYNFTGSSSTEYMFGVDGVNKAFQFDGTTFTQINTGMTTDTPIHCQQHKNHLFLAFSGGSLQHSGIGDPLSWGLASGAGEIGVGTEITSLTSMQGNSLVVSGENRINVLYGTSSQDWDMRSFTTELGVVPETSVLMDTDLVFFNGVSVTSLQATQTFGDFVTASLSSDIASFFSVKESIVRTVVGVCSNKDKGQYRIFYSDGSVGVLTLLNKAIVGWSTWRIPDTPARITEGFMGTSEGKVMKLDEGNSFNGLPIESFLRLPFTSLGQPYKNKRFRKIFVDLDAESNAELKLQADYDYGATSSTPLDVPVYGGGGLWDFSSWGEFIWSSTLVSTCSIPLSGSGRNVALLIYHSSTSIPPFTLQGIRVNFTMRGVIR